MKNFKKESLQNEAFYLDLFNFQNFLHDLKLQRGQHLVYKTYLLQNLIYYFNMKIPLFLTWGIFAIIS
jgi:hypothetical protein